MRVSCFFANDRYSGQSHKTCSFHNIYSSMLSLTYIMNLSVAECSEAAITQDFEASFRFSFLVWKVVRKPPGWGSLFLALISLEFSRFVILQWSTLLLLSYICEIYFCNYLFKPIFQNVYSNMLSLSAPQNHEFSYKKLQVIYLYYWGESSATDSWENISGDRK